MGRASAVDCWTTACTGRAIELGHLLGDQRRANRLWRAELRRGDHVPRPLRGRLQLVDVRISRRTTVRLGDMRGGGHAERPNSGQTGGVRNVYRSLLSVVGANAARLSTGPLGPELPRIVPVKPARQPHLDPQRKAAAVVTYPAYLASPTPHEHHAASRVLLR